MYNPLENLERKNPANARSAKIFMVLWWRRGRHQINQDRSCPLTYNQKEIETKAEAVLVGSELGACPDGMIADDWSKPAQERKGSLGPRELTSERGRTTGTVWLKEEKKKEIMYDGKSGIRTSASLLKACLSPGSSKYFLEMILHKYKRCC